MLLLKHSGHLAIAALVAASLATPVQADTPHVVTSIKPLHALVASVMQGLGTPDLLLDGQASPHTYTLKPSDAKSLQKADVIFWIGPDLESFLAKPIDSLGSKAKVISLIEQPEINKLQLREGDGFDHEDHGESGETHHAEFDTHIWLDPENARMMVQNVAKTLAGLDPVNAAQYEKNASATVAELDGLDAKLKADLAPLQDLPFIVFHDAYQYFEAHYGLKASGAISINPENPPGAAGIAALQDKLRHDKIACVFTEPQFDTKLVTLITEGTPAKILSLDPLGANLEAGPAMYGQLLQQLADAFGTCAGK